MNIFLVIRRNQSVDQINIIIKIKRSTLNAYIKTTYPKLAKIKLSGKYNITNYNGLFGIKLDVNGETFWQMISEMKMTEDYKIFSLQTDITGRKISDIILRVNYNFTGSGSSENHFEAKLTLEDKMFQLVATINIKEMAFYLNLKTPYPDMEEMSLSGQFGSTTLKTVYSLKQGRLKRDVSLQYSSIDDGFHLEVITPTTRIKRMSLRRGSDMGSHSFTFEAEGHDIAVGVIYQLEQFNSFGNVKIYVDYPEREWQYLISLSYDIPQSSLSEGINGKFLLMNNDSEIFSAKLSRTVGSTLMELKTPISGWTFIKLNMVSDWKSVAEIYFQRELRITNIHLEQHGLYNYNIFFQTPFNGYENIAINSRQSQEKIIIQIKNASVLISEISVMVHIDDISKVMGRLEVRWDAAQDIFIQIKTSFNGVSLIFSVDTSFDQVRKILLEITIKKTGITRNSIGRLDFNDYFLEYKSQLLWTDSEIESNSVTKTNFPFLGFNVSQTDVKLQYTQDVSDTIQLNIETETDGVLIFKTISSLTVSLNSNQILLVYSGEFPITQGKIDSKLFIKRNWQTKFELNGTWNQNKFQMKILLGGKNAEAKFNSSFKNLEKLRGNAVWTIANGENSEYGLTTTFESCNDSECTTSLFFRTKIDTEPFSFLTLDLIVPGYLNESLSLKYKEQYLQYSLIADYRGYKTYHLNATLNIWRRSIDIVINNMSESRLWKLKTIAEIHTLLDGNVAVNVQLIFYTPFTQNFKFKVIVDMVNPEKQFELTFKYGIIDASLKTKFFWSFNKSLLFIRVLCPSIGIQNISLFGRTESSDT